MILSGQSIRSRCLVGGMVTPFMERTVHNGMSYGLSIAGYDVRVAQDIVLPPKGFSLASTLEGFHMPLDVIAFVKDKSTWARRGLAVQNTVIEPGWIGFLTLELSNNIDRQLTIRAGDPIAQIIFQLTDIPVERGYAGKYQYQAQGPVEARDER